MEYEAIFLGSGTRKFCDACVLKERERIETEQLQAKKTQEENYYKELVRLSDFPPKWVDTRFENSDEKINPKAFTVARGYAQEFTTKSHSMIFYSPTKGTGKTHLAVCIGNHVLHTKKASVRYMKARDLLLQLRNSFSDRESDSEEEILRKVLSVDLLILDDVGWDSTTHWTYSTYSTIFDRRLEYELPVVVTVNEDPDPLNQHGLVERIGDRALSRLLGMCQNNIIELKGRDLR